MNEAIPIINDPHLRIIMGHDLRWWKSVVDFLLLASLALGAIAAVTIGFTTYFSMRWGDEIIDFKDRQIAIDKISSDAKVADAAKAASDAAAVAYSAGETAGHAQAGLDAANVTIAEQQTKTAQAELETERLKAANLDLAAAVSPRVLEQALTGKALEPFSDIAVVVRSSPDFEPRQTAAQIRWMLLVAAHWKNPESRVPDSLHFWDGVVIHPVGAGSGSARTFEAANALVNVLEKGGVSARLGFPVPSSLRGAVLVEVGPKPLPKSLQIGPNSIPPDANHNRVYGNMLEE